MKLRSSAPFVAAAMSLCFAATWVQAQDRGKATPEVRLTAAAQGKGGENAKRLVGTWGIERPGDKENNETITTLLEFRADGSYATRVRSSVFKDQEKQPLASGRYSIAEDNGKSFTLVLERAPGDPEESKDTATTRMLVAVVDENTLRAEDGSTVRRTR